MGDGGWAGNLGQKARMGAAGRESLKLAGNLRWRAAGKRCEVGATRLSGSGG